MRLSQPQRAQVTNILKKQADVLAAFLFGSQARGTAGPLSDVDIGLVLRPKLSPARRATLMKKLFIECTISIQTDYIDLIDLASAPTLLRYQALIAGEKLFVRDEEAFYPFLFRTVQMYEDFRPHLNTQAKLIRKKISSYVTS